LVGDPFETGVEATDVAIFNTILRVGLLPAIRNIFRVAGLMKRALGFRKRVSQAFFRRILQRVCTAAI
jgi:hypothetical protein